ncbi:MAG: hypothetical protein KIT84_30055 [Labilithrix sp.]|nr:hypothetical protein [Labilithrix sp.]MCW5815308.1 hypothetical protein [Labilithrix sp.]
MKHRLLFSFFVLLGPALACNEKKPQVEPTPVIDSAPMPVPPVAISGVPVSTFVDAALPTTPYEQARQYEENGQHWMARLVLEPKAFGAEGTKPEIELLAHVCNEQGDEVCVDKCAQKLGVKKLKLDGGLPKTPPAEVLLEHKEPDTDAAKARDLFLKKKTKEARDILEPKVVEGKASTDEIRLLKTICKEQGDRMCVALCDAKLK